MAISDELKAQILRYHFVEHWRVGTIASQLGVHHYTVERVLSEAGVERERQRERRASKLDPYLALITETLEQFPTLTAARLFDMVKARGYPGGPDHFRHCIAQLRPRRPREAYLRLRTLPGEQSQVDWAHFGKLTIGRAERPLMAFVLVLSYSRYLNYDNRYAEPPLRGRHPQVPHRAGPHHDQQTLLRVGRRVLLRRLCRHPRRPPHPSLRNRPARRRKLSTPRGQGTSRQTLQGPFAPHRQIPCIVRNALMNHQPPPLITVPLDLSDEAAARLIGLLLEIAHRMENHYSEQLYRYHNAIDERQADLWSDTDPPF